MAWLLAARKPNGFDSALVSTTLTKNAVSQSFPTHCECVSIKANTLGICQIQIQTFLSTKKSLNTAEAYKLITLEFPPFCPSLFLII